MDTTTLLTLMVLALSAGWLVGRAMQEQERRGTRTFWRWRFARRWLTARLGRHLGSRPSNH